MDGPAPRPHSATTARLAKVILAAGMAVTLGIFAIGRLSGRAELQWSFDYIHWTISFGLAAVLAWMGVREAPAEHRRVRRWLALGLTCNAAGQLLWETALYFDWDPFPAPSDYLFLSMGLCFSAGMISILRSLPSIGKPLALDVSSLALVVLTLTLDLYLPQLSALRPVEVTLMVAYPIALLLPGCICIVLAPTLRWRFDHHWVLFLVSSLANGAAWMEWNRLTVLDHLQSGTLLNLSFSVITLFAGYGAYAWRPQVELGMLWERHCEQVLRLIPLGVVAAAVISGAIASWVPGVVESVQLATFIGAALVIGLAVARQNLSLIEFTERKRSRAQLDALVTDLKRTEEQLRTALSDLSIAAEAAQLSVGTWYIQKGHVVCDSRMFELYGVEPLTGPVPRSYFNKRIHPDDIIELRRRLGKEPQEGGDFSHEFRVVLPEGRIRWLEMRASIQCENDVPTRVTGVHWDITKRKQAEAERLQLEAQLRQAQKLEAIGTLAGGIAHDFNNILSAILGNTELARQDLERTHALQSSLDEIRKASLRGKDLVQRLLAFGRPQDQRRERLHLQTVIHDSVELLRPAMPASVEIAVHVEPDPAPAVLVDAVQISQVIVNLGMNAYQAMQDHKGRIDISVATKYVDASRMAIAGLGSGRYVCLSVQDDGTGMTAETLEHVFEPFFTTKSLGQGTGLGLAVVHGIVHAHDGAITIDSAPGRGTRFDIYLPALEDQTDLAPPTEHMQAALVKGRGERILYLDDEEALVYLARRLLDRMGYRTHGYTDVGEALHAFRARPTDYDLFITDLSMPDMSGMEVAKEVLRIRPEALVVLASGYVRSQDIEEARAIGIREVILKPNTVEELADVVHTLLARRGEPGEVISNQ